MSEPNQTTTEETVHTNSNNLKNIFALNGKNTGCSLQLRGKVVLVAFLINDGESSWDPLSEKALVEMLKSASERLMADSKLNKKDFQVAYAFKQVDIPYIVNRKTKDSCIFDVLRQFGYENVVAYQKHYEQKFCRDEAAISFVFNKNFRSYAYSTDRSDGKLDVPGPQGEEYSFVSFDKNDLAGSERTFLHELMHQFGAIDFYYPEYLKIKAQKYLPDSIMNGGNIIDDLTRFVIGWDEQLSSAATDFLESISSLTDEDVAFALRAEWQED